MFQPVQIKTKIFHSWLCSHSHINTSRLSWRVSGLKARLRLPDDGPSLPLESLHSEELLKLYCITSHTKWEQETAFKDRQ